MNNDAIERRWELARRCFAAWLAILLLWGSNFVIIFSVGMRGFAGSEYGPLLDFGFIVLCTLPQAMAVGLLLFNFPRKSPFKPLAYLMLLQGALFLGYSCVNSERETRYFSAILAIASLFTAFICFRSKKPLAYLMLLQGALFLWGSCVNSGEGRNIYAVFAIASLFTAFICFRSEQGSKWLSVSKLWLIPLLTFAVLLIMATLREVSMHASEKVFQAEAAKELKEQRKAFEEFRAAAAGGDADAQREMGRCYASGEGVAKDHGEAVKWYRKAAQQGDREARNIADDLQKKIEAKPAEKKPGE
jgi:hypothetical protein